MKFRVLPEADGEAIAAALWYDDRKAGLGDEFLSEVQTAFDRIRADPLSCAKLEDYSGTHDIRRVLLRRFPYMAILRCRTEEILIVAISHGRRRPLYWLERLDQ